MQTKTRATEIGIVESQICLYERLYADVHLIGSVGNPPTPRRHDVLRVKVVPFVVECHLTLVAELRTIFN